MVWYVYLNILRWAISQKAKMLVNAKISEIWNRYWEDLWYCPYHIGSAVYCLRIPYISLSSVALIVVVVAYPFDFFWNAILITNSCVFTIVHTLSSTWNILKWSTHKHAASYENLPSLREWRDFLQYEKACTYNPFIHVENLSLFVISWVVYRIWCSPWNVFVFSFPVCFTRNKWAFVSNGSSEKAW